MSFTSTIRVKEKIRYDINVHREQNKQILLNSRRGVAVEESDISDVFTIEDMKNLALEIKSKRKITVKHLKMLKHALLNGQEFILSFYQVQGTIDALLHFVSSKFVLIHYNGKNKIYFSFIIKKIYVNSILVINSLL